MRHVHHKAAGVHHKAATPVENAPQQGRLQGQSGRACNTLAGQKQTSDRWVVSGLGCNKFMPSLLRRDNRVASAAHLQVGGQTTPCGLAPQALHRTLLQP